LAEASEVETALLAARPSGDILDRSCEKSRAIIFDLATGTAAEILPCDNKIAAS
jgi:hypothetical protein